VDFRSRSATRYRCLRLRGAGGACDLTAVDEVPVGERGSGGGTSGGDGSRPPTGARGGSGGGGSGGSASSSSSSSFPVSTQSSTACDSMTVAMFALAAVPSHYAYSGLCHSVTAVRPSLTARPVLNRRNLHVPAAAAMVGHNRRLYYQLFSLRR